MHNPWKMARQAAAFGALLLSAAIPVFPHAVAAEDMRTWQAEGAFEDVLQDVEDAIVGQGLKITYRADIAGMLARTGKDLGFRPIYKGGQVLQFCSARLSYEAMKADAANIAFCPYGIFVFQTLQQPEKVSVGFRPLPIPDGISAESRKAREAINALLKGIVAEAVGE